MILAKPTGSSNPNLAVHRAQAGNGRFMLTLCTLAAPVSIRPPQSPALKPFTFFMSRADQPDGSERWYLHMGYFDSLGDAEKWVSSVRRHYPTAFATLAPIAAADPGAPASLPVSHPVVAQSSDPATVKKNSLTDTQVLKILEKRRVSAVQDNVDERNYEQIELLRPEDTGVRQALKEAVAQGAPVSFAVQLHWSMEPIDLSNIRSPAIFKAYTLYATESRRKGRSRYFLRLGFFPDPISAKQVAVQIRSRFASAAVVPVVEPEVTRAREASTGISAIPYLAEQRVDWETEADATPKASTQAKTLRDDSRRVARGAERVDRTLDEPLAEREMWTESDPLSESGVRHLRVEVQEHLSGRWKTIRLNPKPSDVAHVDS